MGFMSKRTRENGFDATGKRVQTYHRYSVLNLLIFTTHLDPKFILSSFQQEAYRRDRLRVCGFGYVMKNKKLILILLSALAAGILWYALTQEWLIINLPFGKGALTTHAKTGITTHKKIGVYVPKQGAIRREERELLWCDDAATNASYLTTAWLNILDDELTLAKKTSLQSVAAAHDGRELIISFDRPPLNKNSSTAEKLLLIESLLKSVRESLPLVKTTLFLVHHKHMHDAHLDFSRPWPVSGFIDTQTAVEKPILPDITGPFTLMIDPAGDAQKTGRTIGDTFERSITYACAQALKEELEKTCGQLRVIITREPGEATEPLQSATFTNRLRAHLFINLSCYQATQDPAICALYHFLYDPITDFWYKKDTKMTWEPYFSAHCPNLKTSVYAIKTMHERLITYRQRGLFQLSPYQSIPFRPLIGVQAPAIGCEIGISNPDGWRLLIGPLVDGISHVVELLRTKSEPIF